MSLRTSPPHKHTHARARTQANKLAKHTEKETNEQTKQTNEQVKTKTNNSPNQLHSVSLSLQNYAENCIENFGRLWPRIESYLKIDQKILV
jgi:hypothetical protein